MCLRVPHLRRIALFLCDDHYWRPLASFACASDAVNYTVFVWLWVPSLAMHVVCDSHAISAARSFPHLYQTISADGTPLKTAPGTIASDHVHHGEHTQLLESTLLWYKVRV